jgi:hypothetical protein
MAARTADNNLGTSRADSRLQAYQVLAAETIYKGVPVSIDGTSKYLQENDGSTITLANGDIFVGISNEGVNNSAGASGDKKCNVNRNGSFLLTFSDTLTIADLGKLVFVNNVSDDSVVTVTTDSAAPQLTIGEIVEFVSASTAVVSIDNYVGFVAVNG